MEEGIVYQISWKECEYNLYWRHQIHDKKSTWKMWNLGGQAML